MMIMIKVRLILGRILARGIIRREITGTKIRKLEILNSRRMKGNSSSSSPQKERKPKI